MSASKEQPIDHLRHRANLPANVVPFIRLPDPLQNSSLEGEGGFDLIDHAATLLRNSELRACEAEARAEKVSAKAIDAVRAAQIRIEQTEARARQVEQHAAEQVKLAQERIETVEALAEERIAKAEACAEAEAKRAHIADCRLQAAEDRARNAEERLEQFIKTLTRRLSSPPSTDLGGEQHSATANEAPCAA